MGTAVYRYDYAKFLIECHPQDWAGWYGYLNRQSHERKYSTEWLKSHKVNRLWYNAAVDMETWSIDIWGEWAGIVEVLDDRWFACLKRLDARSIVWDADEAAVSSLGMHLYSAVTSFNVHVYNTRPAAKRMGRDRGGVGFAIGSHKSDLRISCYKRTGEPVALEFQMKGAYLERLKAETIARGKTRDNGCDPWLDLKYSVRDAGEARLERVLDAAGIGNYWPVIGPIEAPTLPPTQAAFLPELPGDHDGSLLPLPS